MAQVFLGRQAILDRDQQTFAYELLYRSGEAGGARVTDGNAATARVLMNTLVEFGLERVISDRLAFINLTRDLLLGDSCFILPKDRVVLEILEDTEPDAHVIAAATRLKSEGFTIALDDFVFREALRPLIEIASIIKVEIPALNRGELEEHVRTLRPFGVKLLAEKVETHDVVEHCLELGFDYFQGYFFCKPQVLSESGLPSSRLAAMRLLAKLQDPAIRLPEMQAAVSEDLTISYKLLRFVNSAGAGLNRTVDSIRHAISLVGMRRIRDWASLLALASMDDKPRELLMTAVTRARMCEELAENRGARNADMYFTVGLFSVLDALLDRPMSEALALLPLATDVQEALTGFKGDMGRVLQCSIAFEKGEWLDSESGIDPDSANQAFMNAVQWAREATSGLGV